MSVNTQLSCSIGIFILCNSCMVYFYTTSAGSTQNFLIFFSSNSKMKLLFCLLILCGLIAASMALPEPEPQRFGYGGGFGGYGRGFGGYGGGFGRGFGGYRGGFGREGGFGYGR